MNTVPPSRSTLLIATGILITVLIAVSAWSLPPLPLHVSGNGHYFEDASNEPFFYSSDTAWSLFQNLTSEDADYYLSTRSSQQFTVISSHLLPWNWPETNAYGHAPFHGSPDMLAFNESYWQHVDWIINKASEKNLCMTLCPAWMNNNWRDILNTTAL